jgi:hypothetical protein
MKNSLAIFTSILLALSLHAITQSSVACAAQAKPPGKAPAASESKEAVHEIYGTIRSIEGDRVTIETRAQKTIQVDLKPAIEAHRSVVPVVGRSLQVRGTLDSKGVLHATMAQRAKDSPALWPDDK